MLHVLLLLYFFTYFNKKVYLGAYYIHTNIFFFFELCKYVHKLYSHTNKTIKNNYYTIEHYTK